MHFLRQDAVAEDSERSRKMERGCGQQADEASPLSCAVIVFRPFFFSLSLRRASVAKVGELSSVFCSSTAKNHVNFSMAGSIP